MPNTPITITAVWLRKRGNNIAQVLVEIDGHFHLAIEEYMEGEFSHIAEGNGAKRWPLDPVTEKPRG